MGTRREQQEDLWIPTSSLARPGSHPFYERLDQLLGENEFGRFVEGLCRRFYASIMGRPGGPRSGAVPRISCFLVSESTRRNGSIVH